MKKSNLFIALLFICTSANLLLYTPAFAQYTKLYDFSGNPDGRTPYGGLVSDGTFLYGMSWSGGSNNLGTIYKIMPNGTGYSKLLDFTGIANGSYPYGHLIFDGTYLYGMTDQGGTNDMGTIFKIMPNGTGYVKLLDFSGTIDGRNPLGSLFSDGIFLYGMTSAGGLLGDGVLFKIMTNGTGYTKLLDFTGISNGRAPIGSLMSDGTFLYGMTSQGGTNSLGTLFKIMPDGTAYSKLLDFDGTVNGSYPGGALISVGTMMYGITRLGGTNNMGTIFKIKNDGTGYSKLLNFSGIANGGNPSLASLIYDGIFLYGMTNEGGTDNTGVAFKIKPDGTGYFKMLDFWGPFGSNPSGSLISDRGILYGIAYQGGTNDMGTIFKFNTFVIDSVNATMVNCYGGNNGTATVMVSGGFSPYNYSWSTSPVQTTQTATGLTAGTYTVTVTDANSTTATETITITQPFTPPVFTASQTSESACNGGSSGSITVTASGGTGTIEYSKDGGGTFQASNLFNGLVAGTYPVVIKDANNCLTTAQNIIITEPQLLSFTYTSVNVSCYGMSTGSISVTAAGGTGATQYSLDGGSSFQGTNVFNGLAAGIYSVLIKDANNCISSPQSVIITEPPTAIAGSIASQTNVSCYGGNNGTVTILASGGTGTLNFMWAPSGGTTASANGLAAGIYICTISDANSCTKTQTVTITQPGATPTPEICMVTVDDGSVNNVIYWDKTLYASADSFIVYRETISNTYKRIGAVSVDSMSMMMDTVRALYFPFTGDPNVGTYRYKLQVRDTCGNYSPLSLYHNTIYATQTGGTFTWNDYKIEGQPTPISQLSSYMLIRDNNSSGNWAIIGGVAGTQTTVTDPNYAIYPNASWRIETNWSISCNPTRATINTTRSNIKGNGISIGILAANEPASTFDIYPNPAKDNVTIEFSSLTTNAKLNICNVLGQTVYSEQLMASSGRTVKFINTSNFSSGVYTIVIETEKEKVFKKLVINK